MFSGIVIYTFCERFERRMDERQQSSVSLTFDKFYHGTTLHKKVQILDRHVRERER
jgi:hypothetical protein